MLIISSLGIYVHIPFCNNKCPYCDFYSLKKSSKDHIEYVSTLKKEIFNQSNKIDKKVDTIYFGGGTPSLIDSNLVIQIIKTLKKYFNVSKDVEITLEVNPCTLNNIDFSLLYNNGVNRLSIGMQSSINKELKALGRMHTKNDVVKTVKKAQENGFDNISLDLMLGIPYQTKESVQKSIKFCADNNVQHVSSYLLKIEKGTPFYYNKENLPFMSDDDQADIYLYACSELEKKGFKQYEISNFSKTNKESKHNLKYWNCEDYLGLGPSAHSLVDNKRFYYNSTLKEFKEGIITEDGIGNTEEEYIIMQLRLNSGLKQKDYKEKFNKEIPQKIFKKAEKYEKQNLLSISDKGIRLNKEGFLLSNVIIADLI